MNRNGSLPSIGDNSELEAEQSKFLASFRLQRHDWLNHFQVLLGYLKLQRYDLCEEYIKKVTESTNNESRIAGLGIQALVAYLCTYNAVNKNMKLEVEMPEPIDLSWLALNEQQRIFDLIKGIIETYRLHSLDNEGLPNTLVVTIQKLEDSLYVFTEYEGHLDDESSIIAIRSLASMLGNEEGFFVEGLHNNEESIMEFYVPFSGIVK